MGAATYVSVAVIETKRQSARAQLGFDDIFLRLPPGQWNDFGVVLPRLLLQDGGGEQSQIYQ